MSTIVGQASNVRIAVFEGKPVGMGEIVVLVAEPVYSTAIDGVKKDYTVQQRRFEGSAKSLRALASWIGEVADDVEELESRTSISAMEP